MRPLRLAITLALAAALAAAAAPTARAGSTPPGGETPPGVLVAMIWPFAGQTERGALQVWSRDGEIRAGGAFAGLGSAKGFVLAASRQPCSAWRTARRSGLVATTFGRGSGGAVTIDEASAAIGFQKIDYVLIARRSSSGLRYVGCGPASWSLGASNPVTSGTSSAVDGGAVRALVSTLESEQGTRVQAHLMCRTPAACRRLMEEEGIFYLSEIPCGQPAQIDKSTPLLLTNARRRGNAITFTDVLVSSVKGTASVRLQAGDRELGCGRALPTSWATFPSS